MEKTEKLNSNFIFPYSPDKTLKRQQVWNNLQNGLLLEDKKILIPWLTPFNRIGHFKENRHDSADRTQWYLGKRTILDGYEGQLEVTKWMWLPWTNSFERISAHLGFGKEGHNNFLSLISHLKQLLGEPTKTELELESESSTEGSYEWSNGAVIIRVCGIDRHGASYMLYIGRIEDKNEEYFKRTFGHLGAFGLSEEELGQ